jgi:prepilin peptidase CpaA
VGQTLKVKVDFKPFLRHENEFNPMSSINPALPAAPNSRLNRNHLWVAAFIAPLLVAPIWFSMLPDFLQPIQSFSGLVLALLILCTTFTDLRWRKIFNWASYTACGWAFAICVLPSPFSAGSIGLNASFAGFATCFVLMLIPYSLARGGAGDVKLSAAIGALLGVGDGLLVIAFAYISAAVCIVGWTILKQGPFSLMRAFFRMIGARWLPRYVPAPTEKQTVMLEQPIPLAGFFAVATLAVVFDLSALLRGI